MVSNNESTEVYMLIGYLFIDDTYSTHYEYYTLSLSHAVWLQYGY